MIVVGGNSKIAGADYFAWVQNMNRRSLVDKPAEDGVDIRKKAADTKVEEAEHSPVGTVVEKIVDDDKRKTVAGTY